MITRRQAIELGALAALAVALAPVRQHSRLRRGRTGLSA